MPATIRVDNYPVMGVGYRVDGSVQHGVHQVGTRADDSTDHHTIEADGMEAFHF